VLGDGIEDLGAYLGYAVEDYDDNLESYMRWEEKPFRGAPTGPFSAPRVYKFWTETRPSDVDVDDLPDDELENAWVINQEFEVTVREIKR